MFTLKSDAFRAARGGYSRFLRVSCAKCGSPILLYQKDGAGVLKRLYLDRIHDAMAKCGRECLACQHCGETLGTRIVYEKESRPAYRLYQNAIAKKVCRARTWRAPAKEKPA